MYAHNFVWLLWLSAWYLNVRRRLKLRQQVDAASAFDRCAGIIPEILLHRKIALSRRKLANYIAQLDVVDVVYTLLLPLCDVHRIAG